MSDNKWYGNWEKKHLRYARNGMVSGIKDAPCTVSALYLAVLPCHIYGGVIYMEGLIWESITTVTYGPPVYFP